MTPATPPVVRFAPSPTGRLHIGNLRPAILNWLFAKKSGGTFILRFDDTDVERSKEEHVEAARRDLEWVGLKWDREERQSLRTVRYDEVAAKLKASGDLYPCYEAEDELDRRRKRQLARGLPPTYDRASLRLTDAERAALEAEGRKPYWRFRLKNIDRTGSLDPVPTLVTWMDLVRGDQSVDVGSLSDPVLIRADGSCLYTFTSVVDDVDFAITHIIRGEDHVTNTAVQIQDLPGAGRRAAAGSGITACWSGATARRCRSRFGSLSLEGMRADGIEPLSARLPHGAGRHLGCDRAVPLTRSARAEVRRDQAVARAGAVRHGGFVRAECQAAARDAFQFGSRAALGAGRRRRRGILAGCPQQHPPRGRREDVVGHRERGDHTRDRECGILRRRRT